jgi:hypothetical protein
VAVHADDLLMGTDGTASNRQTYTLRLLRNWTGLSALVHRLMARARNVRSVLHGKLLASIAPASPSDQQHADDPRPYDRFEGIALWTAGITIVAAGGLITVLGVFLLAYPGAATQIQGLNVYAMTQWALLTTVVGGVCLWDKATRERVMRTPRHQQELQRAAKALQQAMQDYELALANARRCEGYQEQAALRKVAPFISEESPAVAEHSVDTEPTRRPDSSADRQKAANTQVSVSPAPPSAGDPVQAEREFIDTVRLQIAELVAGSHRPAASRARSNTARPASANVALFDPSRWIA